MSARLAIKKLKIFSCCEMKNILAEERRLKEQIQNQESDEIILKRYYETVSKTNENDNNIEKVQYNPFKKLTQLGHLGNAKDLKTWIKHENVTQKNFFADGWCKCDNKPG